MNPVIGIISYFPDNKKTRENRKIKLDNLLLRCKEIFNLPVMIIAQNYLESEIWYYKNKYPNTLIFDSLNKLGILGARKELRRRFLNSDYDYLIMLDDDCKLYGNNGREYLKQINENPGCFIEFKGTLLKLFAISKELFSIVDYEDVNPEAGEGFEDRVFVNKLRIKYPDKRRWFKDTTLEEESISTADPDSTWYERHDTIEMLKKTEAIIDGFKS